MGRTLTLTKKYWGSDSSNFSANALTCTVFSSVAIFCEIKKGTAPFPSSVSCFRCKDRGLGGNDQKVEGGVERCREVEVVEGACAY